MNVAGRPIIVVLGMMTTVPVGGVIWQTVQYLVGLERLGFEVYYVEDHGVAPSMFTDDRDPDGTLEAAEFLARTLDRFGFGTRWSYRAWHKHADDFHGLGKVKIEGVLARAATVINLHGSTLPRPEYLRAGPLIYLETDPVAPEIELHNGMKATEEFLDAHKAHFTYGENIGAPDCKVPAPPARYRFHPTRQPIVLDFWEAPAVEAAVHFTTIANWKQSARQMELEGEVYSWSKHHEFLKFLELPRTTGQSFELALSSFEPADREMLERFGWKVRRALDFSTDLDAYRNYIFASRGEWTVAKDQNVRLKSGWFSDRAASYLAAGKPVVTQETGFSNVLPTGCGLFGFSTLDEAAEAIREINLDYQKHSRAAREIASEHFRSDAVLRRLLIDAGVSS